MNWEATAAIAHVVAAIGVSLLYLVTQVRPLAAKSGRSRTRLISPGATSRVNLAGRESEPAFGSIQLD